MVDILCESIISVDFNIIINNIICRAVKVFLYLHYDTSQTNIFSPDSDIIKMDFQNLFTQLPNQQNFSNIKFVLYVITFLLNTKRHDKLKYYITDKNGE